MLRRFTKTPPRFVTSAARSSSFKQNWMVWFPLIKAEQLSLRLERRKRNMWEYRAHAIMI